MSIGVGLRLAIDNGDGVSGFNGADLALWFDANKAYKSSGGGIVTPDSILTYTAPSPKLVYGSDGVLGYAPHNLVRYSEQLQDAAWTKSQATVSANATVAPDGTITADAIIPSTEFEQHFAASANIAAGTYTWSAYFKAAGYTKAAITCYVSGPTYSVGTLFDLSNGTIVSSIAGTTSTIISVGGGWYRCSVTATLGGTSNFGGAQYRPNINGVAAVEAATGDGVSGIYIWGVQLNNGPTALTYIPTTTAAVYSLPRDHNPTTGAALGVLVEEARTNLCLYSDDFTNAAWVKSNLTAAKTATGPDGVANSASTLTATAANATAQQAITSASAARITSMFVKRRTGTGAVTLSQGETGASLLSDDFSSYADTAALLASGWDEFNGGLLTISAPGEVTFTRTSLAVERGAILVSGFVVGQAYQIEADITAISSSGGIVYVATTPTALDVGTLSSTVPGNNLRSPVFIATATSMYVGFRRTANGTTTYSRVQINAITETTVTVTSDWTRVATASATVTNPSVLVKLVTSGDAIDVALFQIENGAFITSPIPTQASQVTRAADQVSILTSAFPWVNAQGTMVADFTPVYADNGGLQEFMAFTAYAGNTHFVQAYLNTTTARSGQPSFQYRNSTSVIILGGSNDLSPPNPGQQKWGLSFEASSILRASRQGSTVGAEAALVVTASPVTLWLGSSINGTVSINGHIKRFAHYASLKSQAELNTLTAL